MSTTVVYASGDSGCVRVYDATYLTAVRGDGSFTTFAASITGLVGQAVPGDYFAYQAFLKWDTSAVGTDTVSNVDFEVEGNTDATATEFTVEGYSFDWGATLTTADYRDTDTGIPALGSIISSYDTTGGFDTTAGYNNDLGANAAFASAINGSGDTRIILLSDRTRTETTSTGNEYVDLRATGATNDARLTITHASATLYTAIDDDPDSPDATVITATAS